MLIIWKQSRKQTYQGNFQSTIMLLLFLVKVSLLGCHNNIVCPTFLKNFFFLFKRTYYGTLSAMPTTNYEAWCGVVSQKTGGIFCESRSYFQESEKKTRSPKCVFHFEMVLDRKGDGTAFIKAGVTETEIKYLSV